MNKPVSAFIFSALVAMVLINTGCSKELTPAQEQKGQTARDLAIEISRALNGRFGDLHELIVEKGNRDNPEYREFQKTLAEYVELFPVTYIYTLIKVNNDMTNLIVDASEDEEADEYGTEYEMDGQIEASFAGTPDYSREIWKDDDFGLQISAFAPLYNTAGKLVALIGVDAPL